jgi:hypothetical protein
VLLKHGLDEIRYGALHVDEGLLKDCAAQGHALIWSQARVLPFQPLVGKDSYPGELLIIANEGGKPLLMVHFA